MKYLLLSFLFTITFNQAFAGWSDASIRVFESFKSPQYSDAGFFALWGGVQRTLKKESLDGDDLEWEFPLLKEKLKIYLRTSTSQLKRPLVIVFPGIYGNHRGQVTPIVLNHLEESDYHIASLPNFLNHWYVKAAPQYSDQNFSQLDRDVAFYFIEKLVDTIGASRISQVTLIGESLGAFLAVSLGEKYKRLKSFNGVKLKNLILMWPPLNLAKSLNAFDHGIETANRVYKNCSYLNFLWQAFDGFFVTKSPEVFSSEAQKCFSALMYNKAFMRSVSKSFDEMEDSDEVAEPENFNQFFKLYNPNFLKVLGDKKNLFISKLRSWSATSVNVKIISSLDDFINEPNDWKEIKEAYLFEKGSHSGLLAYEFWGPILRSEVE